MKKVSSGDFLTFSSREGWRTWLSQNGGKAEPQWVMIFKKHAREKGLRLGDAVEEALCFGWIDGMLKGVDDAKYLLRFSPRKQGSIWSVINKKRAEKLIAAGKMTDAGLAKIQDAKLNGQWDAAYTSKTPTEFPADLRNALQEDPEAKQNFEAFSNSTRFQYIHWIDSAKTDQTRQKRIAGVVLRSRLKKKPGEKT
jgi:uncharacterized protein YdeI (YjbR/CyaY-like superfamily)